MWIYRESASLSLAGMGLDPQAKDSSEEERKREAFASKLRSTVNAAVNMKADERKDLLLSATHEVYFQVAGGRRRSEIPFLPPTEAHGQTSLRGTQLLHRPDDDALRHSAYRRLALSRADGEPNLMDQDA